MTIGRAMLGSLVAALLLVPAGCEKRGAGSGAAPSGRGAGGAYTIAVIPKGQAHIFWRTVRAGALEAGKELGVTVQWNGPASETEYTAQMNIVENFISQKVNAIVLAPQQRKALVPAVERAAAANIPVVIIDSDADTDKKVSFVATDNYQGGVLAARRMAEILGKKGKVAVVGVAAGSQSTMERERGFQETIEKEFPDVKIVDFQYSESDSARALQVAENFLTKHADLNALYGPNLSSAMGAVQAVRGRNLVGKVKVVGFDASEVLVKALEEGAIDSLVLQDPFKMGYEGVKTAVAQLKGQTPPKRIDTGVVIVTKANMKSPEMQKLLNPRLE
jgi:ribose transport system substrate-binding protein